MKLSRRKLFQVALPAAAAVPLASQLEGQAQAPAPSPGDAELESARQNLRVSVQITRQVALPMTVEPATRFIPRS